MAATRLIVLHINKGKTIEQCLEGRTDYAKNFEKTEDGKYLSSYECDAKSAHEEFLLARKEYERLTGRKPKGDIIAYQIRQSFKPGEITPEEANRLGYETAMRFTKGKHAFIVATHTDKAHIHNHIIFNSVNLSHDKKFRNFLFSGLALQKVSDLICLENGLSVIKAARPSERVKRTTYPEKKTIRELIRLDIDQIVNKTPKDFDEFLMLLENQGYELKRGKHLAIKGKSQNRFIRLDSLGDNYTEVDIRKRLEKDVPQKKQNKKYYREKNFDLLLDMQEIISKGKGYGYERWAKIHNIKEYAKVLLFLQEHNCRDYETLEKRAKDSSERFNYLSSNIKSIEKEMINIAALRKSIINYAKTRDTYVEYRKSGYSKKFFEAHREEILIHKAAKDHFQEYTSTTGEKIPRVKELNVRYQKLLTDKKKVYEDYRKAKTEMQDYQIAKYNVDRIYADEQNNKQKENEKKKEETR